jgi:Holliday junction resolvase RusA-like endonuclease
VLGEPIPKGRPRVNTRTGHAYTPARTRQAESDLGWALRQQYGSGRPPLAGALAVTLRFWLARAGRVDVDNLSKLVLDGANTILWDDDSQIWDLHAVVMGRDGRPRTEITVTAVPIADSAAS